MAYSARPRWDALGGRWRWLLASLGCGGSPRGPAVRGGWTAERESAECWDGGSTGGAGLEKVMVAVKISPAKKADWDGVMFTTRPDICPRPVSEHS